MEPQGKHLEILERIKEWPTGPGIYIMRDNQKRILYVGKAKNLRNRIRSYFQKPEGQSPKTQTLVKKIHELEFTVTNTELEALLLECNLIKKHRPRYNIRLKDDKNFPYVALDFTHPFPQFRITRKIVATPTTRYFGPYSAGVNEIGRFLLKTFQIRDCSDSKFKNRTRPCLNYEIGTCTAPCVGYVSEKDYSKQIQDAILFLKGKKKELLTTFKKEMLAASDKMEYERAKGFRDKIRSVEKITEKQNAVLTEKLKDIDIIGLFVSGEKICIVVLFIRSGFLTGRKIEKIPLVLDSVEETVRSFLEQYYQMALVPDEVWLATDFPGRDVLEVFLTKKAQKKVHIRIPRSEKPLRLLGMAYENAKLIFQEEEKLTKASATLELQKALGLKDPPQEIEGIDVSNFQGDEPAVALVHFNEERPFKNRYRVYHPKTVLGQDDFAMIYETVTRRLKDENNPPPDLFMIDGGIGQLRSAIKAMDDLGITIPVCSLAKSRTSSAFTRKEVEKSEERIFVPNRKNPILLKEGHPALRLLQQVRDEAHRFSVKNHRIRRNKKTFQESSLTDVKGVGNLTREKLLRHFGSIDAIKETTLEEILKLGVNKKAAMELLQSFSGEEE